MKLPKVFIFSDWWARPNPWVWGYGIILCYKDIKKEFSWWYKMTTNNRMELTWVIKALEKLKTKSEVDIFTDSKYTIDWIEKWWAKKWKLNNWYRKWRKKAINYDLWDKLLGLVEQHIVKFHWVKWHNWHVENERCDELATLALQKKRLLVDKWYKEEIEVENNQIKLL
jgi:ribonuclease HI